MKAPDLKQYFCMLFEDCFALSPAGILVSSPHSLCRNGKFEFFFLLLLARVFFHRFTVLIDTCRYLLLLVSKVGRTRNTPVCSLCDLRACYMICASSFEVDLAGIGTKARSNMPSPMPAWKSSTIKLLALLREVTPTPQVVPLSLP